MSASRLGDGTSDAGQIELLISGDGPAIIPVYSAFAFPYRSQVQGFVPSADTFHYYLTAWLSS